MKIQIAIFSRKNPTRLSSVPYSRHSCIFFSSKGKLLVCTQQANCFQILSQVWIWKCKLIGLVTVRNLLSPSCSSVPSGINILAEYSLDPAPVFALACSVWVFNPHVSESNWMCSCPFFFMGQLTKIVFFFHVSSYFLTFVVRCAKETQSWVCKTGQILFFSALLKMPNPRGMYMCAIQIWV